MRMHRDRPRQRRFELDQPAGLGDQATFGFRHGGDTFEPSRSFPAVPPVTPLATAAEAPRPQLPLSRAYSKNSGQFFSTVLHAAGTSCSTLNDGASVSASISLQLGRSAIILEGWSSSAR